MDLQEPSWTECCTISCMLMAMFRNKHPPEKYLSSRMLGNGLLACWLRT